MMMLILQSFVIIVTVSSGLANPPPLDKIRGVPPCESDKVAVKNPYIVNLASQRGRFHKRESDYSNIRIHPVFTNVSSTASEFVHGDDTPLSRAIDTLQSTLLVHSVQGNLTIPPKCIEYTHGSNKGKCKWPSLPISEYKCGEFGVIPLSYIGTREVCLTPSGPCVTKGPNGTGLPNADYLLFVSASSTNHCSGGTLAYASHCMLDSSDNNRPIAGFINICPSALDSFGEHLDLVYGIFTHEIIHALGFSSSVFDNFVDSNGNNYNPLKTVLGPYGQTSIFTGPKTVALARKYYACDDIEGVYLENEGGLGTASSHWEKRTLHHELMNGYISADYLVLSEFTLALFEDSGWYKADYTALYNLKQNPLQWGKGLGCAFLTERCTKKSVFPYLCDTSENRSSCTYDHLSKGQCSNQYNGFDDCPVVLAGIGQYCRTKAQVDTNEYIETYGNSSICVDGIKILSSHSCGIYLDPPVTSVCVEQETYSVNTSNHYALQLRDENYECKDGHALITDENWVILCAPTEEVASRSPSILIGIPSLLSSRTVVTTNLDNLGNAIYSLDNVVVFGRLYTFHKANKSFHVNSINKNDSGTTAVCQLKCRTCTGPIMVDNTTSILNVDALYSVEKGALVASAVFIDSLTQSSDYTLVLMLDPQTDFPFVYYAASIDFIGDHLQALHSNDYSFLRITALVYGTEIRMSKSHDSKIDESESVFLLVANNTFSLSSNADLTGSRVIANKPISFYSGHRCSSDKTTNCSILNEQIPPYNSWGNTFILHTNISGLRGNMFKIIASDVGADVLINCTTDGTNYEANNFNLGLRQHTVLSIPHDYCTVKSDENILIIQFRDSSPPLMDTFMTIIPAVVHFEDSYVLNAHEGFNNYIAITVKDTDPTNNSLMINDNPVKQSWEMIELDGDKYYFSTLMLTAGRYALAFSGNAVRFGAIIYGSNENDTFALPAGMRLNITEILQREASSSDGKPQVN